MVFFGAAENSHDLEAAFTIQCILLFQSCVSVNRNPHMQSDV